MSLVYKHQFRELLYQSANQEEAPALFGLDVGGYKEGLNCSEHVI